MKDYINDTFIRLTDEGRIKDAVAFCEMVAKEAPCVEFRCVALKNVAECHFFMTGNGEACRDANLRGLKLMEDNPDIFNGTTQMSESQIKRLYSDFCEQFRALAVSFEEYEEYCEKPLRVRAQNAAEKRGLMAVEQLKRNNAGWIENMFILLNNYYPQSQWSAKVPAAAQGACIAQLILLNSRTLRAKPLDINFAIQQYQNCMTANIDNLIEKTKRKSFPPIADQIFFTFDYPQEIIESLRSDRRADEPTINTCLGCMKKMREQVSMELYSDTIDDSDYVRLDTIRESFDSEMENLKEVGLGTVGTGRQENGFDQNSPDGFVNPNTGRKMGCVFRVLFLIVIVGVIVWLIIKKISGR